MGRGYLVVQLRYGEDYYPIINAPVIVRDKQGKVVHSVYTDGSGSTAKLALEAPSAELSLRPSVTDLCFSLYDVEVPYFKNLKRENVIGVQIFDTEESILEIDMLPKEAGKSDAVNTDTIIIPIRHGVDFVRRLGMETRNRISGKSETMITAEQVQNNEVPIPEYITVHLGAPNETVNDVRVPFIDYVKNVASSEIFPTWPESALYANIYAQISFALNRIFTVWYPSRGYKFDITSRPEFDQYFVYGRNIFNNISSIVDGIFNKFIQRPGRKEPFAAKYCNGTTSTCDGLAQWGTVTLAEKGYTPIEILRYYYPNDVQIVESINFMGGFRAYPGTPLREGSRGDDVELMQFFLNRIGGNYPLIPMITPNDGVFRASTKNAVMEFQRQVNLAPDGIIGEKTWYQIIRVYVAVAKLAELDSEGERIGIGKVPPTSTITLGARGEEVVELQYLLNAISAFYPQIPEVFRTGRFDEQTKRSTVEFQKNFGLTPDGVVGPTTWNKLYSVYKSIYENLPPVNPPVNPPFPGTVLQVGSRGDDVKLMQTYLNAIAKSYPSIPTVVADGVFGAKTEEAVKAFQRQFGLTVDGKIGQQTWNKIVTVYNGLDNNNPNPVNPPFPGTVLQVGSRGDDVKLMQTYLNAIAKSYPNIPTVVADGIFGAKTEEAVKAFQQQFGLTADGKIGEKTWNKIVTVYNGLDNNNPNPINPPFPGTVLQVGSRGDDVKLMQTYLNAIAKSYPSIPTVVADGVFGTKTEEQVKAFQRQFGLTADGKIGQQTWNKIVTVYNELDINNTNPPNPPNPPDNVNPPFPGTVLQVGSRGEDVRLMQTYLNAIARSYPSIPTVVADGVFGAKTEEAVKAFQRQFGLTVDGKIGKQTWNKIVTVYNELEECNCPNFPGKVLSVGSKGDDVKLMQSYLNVIAKTYTSIPTVVADGIFGAKTEEAVKAFQRQFGLTADGKIGEQTWNKIVSVYNEVTAVKNQGITTESIPTRALNQNRIVDYTLIFLLSQFYRGRK